jgi:hypothetical protein
LVQFVITLGACDGFAALPFGLCGLFARLLVVVAILQAIEIPIAIIATVDSRITARLSRVGPCGIARSFAG